MMKLLPFFLTFAVMAPAFADEARDTTDIQFESLLIQGEVQRPDLTIVTGDPGDGQDGLLRLRKDFLDLMAQDAGEVIE